MSYNDVFNPQAINGNYFGLADLTGTNGNLSVDPQYFNAADLQYELRPGSPVEGAGTSFVSAGVPAPATDFFGNPPFKDPNITGRGDGSGYDMGAIWPQQFATSNIDLATLSVTAPATGTEGETVTVDWTVQEDGSGTATGSWSDAVYLSDTPVFSPDAQFLTRVEHTGSLGPGQSYSGSASVTLNNVLPGNHYILVRCNDLNDIFEGLATANNTAATQTPISFALPSLTLNTPYNDQFTGAGQSHYYQVTVPAGETLVFSAQQAPRHRRLDGALCQPRRPAVAQPVRLQWRQHALARSASRRANSPAGDLFRPGLRRLRFVREQSLYHHRPDRRLRHHRRVA